MTGQSSCPEARAHVRARTRGAARRSARSADVRKPPYDAADRMHITRPPLTPHSHGAGTIPGTDATNAAPRGARAGSAGRRNGKGQSGGAGADAGGLAGGANRSGRAIGGGSGGGLLADAPGPSSNGAGGVWSGRSGRANADVQTHIARRREAQYARAERKRAEEQAAQKGRVEGSRKVAAAERQRDCQLSITEAKESVVPIKDDARASFRFRTGDDFSSLTRKSVPDEADLAHLRTSYRASITPTICHNVFGWPVSNHSRWSVYFIGHRSEAGVVQSFGDKAGLHALLTEAAVVASVE